TQCGPALALGASQAVDLTPDDPLRYEKYPKLNAAWNEIFIKYEAAIGEGISPENAIARAWQGWAAREEYIISEPDSKFPQHRILGWIRFVHSSNFNQKTPTQWLRDFLAAQGISADVRDVFGEFHYDPEDVSGINNIMLPFTLAGPLSELPEVKSLHLVHNAPVYLEKISSTHLPQNSRDDSPTSSSTTNNTASWHGADPWHQAGYTGKGVKIGVIDADFDKIEKYQKTATDNTKPLPRDIKSRCFTGGLDTYVDGDLSKCDRDRTAHGTAVLEAALIIAPEAEIYISNATNIPQLRKAIEWMEQNGVIIINQSLGRAWEGPGDGTSWLGDGMSIPTNTDTAKDLYELIRYAVSKGIMWVNSAGNYADNEIFYGSVVGTENDRWIDFETQGQGFPNPDINSLKPAKNYSLYLRWKSSDPNKETNLDMYLCGNGDCDGSTDSDALVYTVKKGEPAPQLDNRPVEQLIFDASEAFDETPLHLRVCWQDGSKPEWLQVWSRHNVDMTYAGSYYTMNNPGEYDIPGMLAVGAANVQQSSTNVDPTYHLEDFSSRGPLSDDANVADNKLLKPDIVGADNEYSFAYGEKFAGTSQAAPHVAGLAALVKQRYPNYTPLLIANYLTGAAKRQVPDSDDPGFGKTSTAIFNNGWGYGFAHLPNDLPKPTAKLEVSPTRVEVGDSFTVDVAELKPDVTPIKFAFTGPITTGDCSVSALSASSVDEVEIVPTSASQELKFMTCSAGTATIKLLRSTDNQKIASVTVTIVDPDALPTASLTLSDSTITVGETVQVTVNMASPSDAQFKLRIVNLSTGPCVAGRRAPDEEYTSNFETPQTFTFYGCWKGTAKVQLVATDRTPLASPTPFSVLTPTHTTAHTPTPTPTPSPTHTPTATPLPKP
ncbi:MAG: S8 family serine peptidase, partial [Chloroflexi bacterium]|nr:S8 family serine peptidase [Chloroflexota bacterium]